MTKSVKTLPQLREQLAMLREKMNRLNRQHPAGGVEHDMELRRAFDKRIRKEIRDVKGLI